MCDCQSIYRVSIAQWLERWHDTQEALYVAGFEYRLGLDFSPTIKFGAQSTNPTVTP